MQEYKKFAQRIGLIGATNLLISLSALILIPILTKTLPIEEYGTYAQITVTIGLVPAMVMLGLPYTMVRFLAAAKYQEEIQEGYYSIVCVTAVTAGVTSLALFFLAEPIAALLFDDQIMATRILAGIIFLECINGLQLNYFRTFQQIKRYSSFSLLKICLQLILVGTLVITGYGISGAAIGLFITDLILSVILGVLIVSEIGITIPKFKRLREYLSFGLPTVPGNLSSWAVNSSDRYLIALFLGTAFVGYYTPGYTLGNTISMFIAPLSFLLPTALSKYYDEENIASVKIVLSYSMKFYLALAIPSVVGLSLLSKPLLTILSTPEIASAGYMITPFAALGGLMFGLYVIITQILVLEKRTSITGVIWIIAGVTNVAINLLVIPRIGIIGAAVTTFIAYSSAFFMAYYYSCKYLVFHIDVLFIIKSVLAAIIMGLVIAIIGLSISSNLVTLVSVIVMSVLIYGGCLFILQGFKNDEIRLIRDIFRM